MKLYISNIQIYRSIRKILLRRSWATLHATVERNLLALTPTLFNIRAMGHFDFSLSVSFFVPCYFSSFSNTCIKIINMPILQAMGGLDTKILKRERETEREREISVKLMTQILVQTILYRCIQSQSNKNANVGNRIGSHICVSNKVEKRYTQLIAV